MRSCFTFRRIIGDFGSCIGDYKRALYASGGRLVGRDDLARVFRRGRRKNQEKGMIFAR
jgi:hypothetical protein